MGNQFFPTFVGPNADRAARNYAKYDFATRVLDNIQALGNQLRIKGTPPPVEIIDLQEFEVIPVDTIPLTPDKFFGTLVNIDGIGPATANILVSHYDSLTSLSKATVEDLDKLPGIGKIRANQILLSLQNYYKNPSKWTLSK